MARVAVVGAGISGLCLARRLRVEGHDVRVFEAASRAGGVVRTERAEGFLMERGPTTFLGGGAVAELADELGLQQELVTASSESKRRYRSGIF